MFFPWSLEVRTHTIEEAKLFRGIRFGYEIKVRIPSQYFYIVYKSSDIFTILAS